MRTIIVSNAAQIQNGKRAMLIAATLQDTYRQGAMTASADEWQVGRQVDEVTHFGRHSTRVGEKVAVEDDEGRRFGVVRIEGIRMVDTLNLTDEQIRTLGYATFAEFHDREPSYVNRRAWLVSIAPARRWF
jgi:hypothetical protein